MNNKFFCVPQHWLLHAVMTLCIGAGCAYPLALSMNLTVTAGFCLACCAAVTLLFLLLDCIPRLHALAYPTVFAALCVLVMRHAHQMNAISAALTLFLNGQPIALAAYSRVVAALLSLLLTSVGASLARSERAFFPLAALSLVILFTVSFLGVDVSPAALLPLVTALLLSGRAPGVQARRLIPCAALIMACTLLTTPLAGRTSEPLTAFAAKVRQAIDDYLFFTDPRTAFSLSAAGWQPLGSQQLGGPVSPTDDPVMEVSTSERTLLRATIKNRYTGSAWEDATSGRRYLFVNPRFYTLRQNLFDLDRPVSSLRDEFPAYRTITVRMLADSASTLYLTQRFRSPGGESIVAYFSPASEVFATRSLAPGDTYAFSGSPLSNVTKGARRLVLMAENTDDPYLETVQADYAALPDMIDSRIYALAAQITAGAENDYDRASAICSYLQQAFPYTLQQNVPPAGEDFVSWFLFEEQKGYCTSFASAMAVLARAAGLPSRYIEGYVAQPDADGVARVTQQNAHAWVEIYFKGFGWLSFDPTPGQGDSAYTPQEGDDSSISDSPDDDPEQEDNQPEPSAHAQETPSPSPTPTPEPTPTPSPQPTPTNTPEHNDPNITPTPTPVPTPTPTPTLQPTSTPSPTPPPDMPPENDGNTPPWLLFLLALILVIALIALRFVLSSPAYLAGRQQSAADALLVWYRAIEQALSCMDLAPMSGEAPATYLLRAQEALGGRPVLTGLGKALCIARYSSHRIKPSIAGKAETTYRALLAKMSVMQRVRLIFRRFAKGLHL